jgi:hypothetical protein
MSLFGGKRRTVRPDYTGLQVQTASSALPIPVVYGTNRIAPNVIWSDGFQTHAQRGKKAGGKDGGGVVRYSKVEHDVRRLLHDTSAAAVTTMLDLYGLPSDLLASVPRTAGDVRGWAHALEDTMAERLGRPRRFMPHLSVHEFEAFIFLAPERTPSVFTEAQAQRLGEVARAFQGDVERIDSGAQTHPSARLKALVPGYDKVVGGNLALLNLGVPTLHQHCPHFRAWLERLTSL